MTRVEVYNRSRVRNRNMDTRVRFFVSALLLCSLMSLTGGLWGQSGQSTQQAFVVNTGDESVSQVDLESMKEARRFLVGRQPYGIAVSRDGKRWP